MVRISFRDMVIKVFTNIYPIRKQLLKKKINWWELCDVRPTFKDTYYSIAVIEAVTEALLTPKEWRNIDASI